MGLFADRTSCHAFLANQFRVLLSAAAYVLVETLRRVGLAGTELASAQVETIRLKRFTTSFGCPTFLAFGKDYRREARDEYVYVYSFDSASAYEPADRMVLARVPVERITEQAAYEFFVRTGGDGRPEWTADITLRGAVFEHKGRCHRSGILYNAGLKRYLWWQVIPGGETRFKGGFGVYDAPEPWGPWTTVYFTEQWDVGPGESAGFPTQWMSPDGRT